MCRLTKNQIEALKAHRVKGGFKAAGPYMMPRSTMYDAFRRAQNNIDKAIALVEFVAKEQLLTREQILRLKKILKSLEAE